jgi:hypothetical protein
VPVWVISALMGGDSFDELERDAFWQAVEEAPVGDSALTWQLMQAISPQPGMTVGRVHARWPLYRLRPQLPSGVAFY